MGWRKHLPMLNVPRQPEKAGGKNGLTLFLLFPDTLA
jgi:hypothetical protein